MRKLKTFITKSGFFEYAVAAPTKKAAIELLGITEHDFQHHFASQTEYPTIVKTTRSRPGKVLCRPAGTYEKFSEHASLPKVKVSKKTNEKMVASAKERRVGKANNVAEEKELAHLAARAAKAETAQGKVDARRRARQKKIAAAYKHAERRHNQILQKLEAARGKIDAQLQKEQDRWSKEQQHFKS